MSFPYTTFQWLRLNECLVLAQLFGQNNVVLVIAVALTVRFRNGFLELDDRCEFGLTFLIAFQCTGAHTSLGGIYKFCPIVVQLFVDVIQFLVEVVGRHRMGGSMQWAGHLLKYSQSTWQ
ncbi:unnamed protein product [Haemonchus placei]|uniref:Transmembrane protein n=1 Tax=Haemonchus placei TaxID=6290 RepID=A0A0N4VYT3_HAEPC|nr:unnamed protein product [Haemonchus placei]